VEESGPSKDRLATWACQRLKDGKKNPQCPCPPCAARREIFGVNVPIQIQEMRRAAVDAKLISSLKEELREELKLPL